MGRGLRMQASSVNRKVGAAVPFSVGATGPNLTQCGLLGRGLPPCQVAS